MSEQRPGFLARIKNALVPPSHEHMLIHSSAVMDVQPKRLLQDNERVEIKQNPFQLLPRGLMAAADFFSSDGGRTFIEGANLTGTALAFTAYWYCATRWRA